MRYLKRIGLAAAATTALMAFVGMETASATKTEYYSGIITLEAGTTIHESFKTGTSTVQTDTSEGLTSTCEEGTITRTLNATTATPLTSTINKMTWGKCTWATSTVATGTLSTENSGSGNGTVTGSGSQITVKAFNLVTCLYGTGAGTHLGTLDGTESGSATLTINAVINEQGEKKALCPDTTFWRVTYAVTSPAALNIRE